MATIEDIYKQLSEAGTTKTSDFGSAFQSSTGRAPTQEELIRFTELRNTPVRPPTPAPTMLADTSAAPKPQSDDELLESVVLKGLKSKYGDTFSDDEYTALARKQIGFTSKTSPTDELQKIVDDQKKLLQEQRMSEETRMKSEAERLQMERDARLKNIESQLMSRGMSEKEQAKQLGLETQATTERLLGSRGNLTSSVGAAQIKDIQTTTSNTLAAIDARVQAELDYRKAELEGADRATLDKIQANIDGLRQREFEFITESAYKLQEAKANAQAAGDEARAALLQTALDNLSTQKVKSEADAALTKNINDGYIYDKFGQRITDAEGKFVTYETSDEFDSLMEISPGASIYDPATGTFVGTAPLTKQEQEARAKEEASFERSIQNASEAYDEISTLLESPELLRVFGPISSTLPKQLAQNKPALEASIERIQALLTTDNLSLMKGLGAMSDREFQNLSRLATSLRTDLKEETAKQELKRVQESLLPSKEYNDLITAGVSKEEAIEYVKEKYPDSSRFRDVSFNTPVSSGAKSSLKDGAKVVTPFGSGIATGVEAGSKFWKYGLDLALAGGKGAPIPAPVSGTVISAGKEGNWGNSVKIQLADGRVIRLSHLDAINVKPGQQITKGTIVGGQGNTGKTYGKTGIHLDVTIYDENGKPYSSQQVAQLLGVTQIA